VKRWSSVGLFVAARRSHRSRGINKSINTHAGCASDPLRKSFEFATLKAEHERMKKIIRGKATGGCVAVFALVFFDAGFRGLSLLDS